MKKIKFLLCIAIMGEILISCKKEATLVTGNYIGNFYGAAQEYGQPISIDEINVQIVLNEIGTDYLLFDDSSKVDYYADSIQGTFYIPDKDYIIYPYLIGEITRTKDGIQIRGHYAAIYHDFKNINGKFDLISN